MKNNFVRIFVLILICFSVVFFSYKKFFEEDKKIVTESNDTVKDIYNSNIINDVKYISKDAEGNEYIITASKGEIDFANTNIIFLTNVYAKIILKNNNLITISSSFGKYNSINLDTIFSKNVIIKYLKNKISGEYLDFSLNRNSMIVSKNIIYTNLKNILKADVVEIDLKSKDTKIYMYEDKEKVIIKSKN